MLLCYDKLLCFVMLGRQPSLLLFSSAMKEQEQETKNKLKLGATLFEVVPHVLRERHVRLVLAV